MALTGTETLQVLGQNPTGVPAATTFQTTTAEIASLAGQGQAPQAVTTGSTSTNITNYGVTQLTSTGAYTIDGPTAGLVKIIGVTGGTTANKTVRISTANGACTFDGTNNTATFDSLNDALAIVGVSSSRYLVYGNIGSVSFSIT